MLQLLNPLCGPSLDSLHCVLVSLVLTSPQLDAVVASPVLLLSKTGHVLWNGKLGTGAVPAGTPALVLCSCSLSTAGFLRARSAKPLVSGTCCFWSRRGFHLGSSALLT